MHPGSCCSNDSILPKAPKSLASLSPSLCLGLHKAHPHYSSKEQEWSELVTPSLSAPAIPTAQGSFSSADSSWPSPLPTSLTFKAEVSTEFQEDFCSRDKPQLSDLQQGIAHTFLIKRGVGLPLQDSSHS